MTNITRGRHFILGRRDLFSDTSSDDLRTTYWDHRTRAEAAAFDGDYATSRVHHRHARRYLKALTRRGEPELPPADQQR